MLSNLGGGLVLPELPTATFKFFVIRYYSPAIIALYISWASKCNAYIFVMGCNFLSVFALYMSWKHPQYIMDCEVVHELVNFIIGCNQCYENWTELTDWTAVASLSRIRSDLFWILSWPNLVKICQNCNWFTWAGYWPTVRSDYSSVHTNFNLRKTPSRKKCKWSNLEANGAVALLPSRFYFFFSDLRPAKGAFAPEELVFSVFLLQLYSFSLFRSKEVRSMSDKWWKLKEEIHFEGSVCVLQLLKLHPTGFKLICHYS